MQSSDVNSVQAPNILHKAFSDFLAPLMKLQNENRCIARVSAFRFSNTVYRLSFPCNRVYTQDDRRRNRSERSSQRLLRVGCSIKQVFVVTTIACSVYYCRTIAATVASCIHYRRSSPRLSLRQSRRRSPGVHALHAMFSNEYVSQFRLYFVIPHNMQYD